MSTLTPLPFTLADTFTLPRGLFHRKRIQDSLEIGFSVSFMLEKKETGSGGGYPSRPDHFASAFSSSAKSPSIDSAGMQCLKTICA